MMPGKVKENGYFYVDFHLKSLTNVPNDQRPLLFNHIPKTGGVTLRIILNRVYGPERIFLIESADIGSSLRSFRHLSDVRRQYYRVVAGHGAELFRPLLEHPFRITLLREPVSLFQSQYHFLSVRKENAFHEEVSQLKSLEAYLDYAVEKGQDNLLTRYLSGSVGFLADPREPVPAMSAEGDRQLASAIRALHDYDAVIDQARFDAGIFALSAKLGWKRIPLYRPANRNRTNPGPAGIPESLLRRLQEALRYDLELYRTFREEELALDRRTQPNPVTYPLFRLRQKGIGWIDRRIRK